MVIKFSENWDAGCPLSCECKIQAYCQWLKGVFCAEIMDESVLGIGRYVADRATQLP